MADVFSDFVVEKNNEAHKPTRFETGAGLRIHEKNKVCTTGSCSKCFKCILVRDEDVSSSSVS